jgi:hypothetical protein
MAEARRGDPGHPERTGDLTVHIGFPVRCRYRGGHAALGSHGSHLWIRDGRIGHGELRLTHSVPLTDVATVAVEVRRVGGSEARTLMAPGLGGGMGQGGTGAGRGPHATGPKLVTDVIVRTTDGQEARWVVEDRDGQWVRERLTPVLRSHGIPYADDPPSPAHSTDR